MKIVFKKIQIHYKNIHIPLMKSIDKYLETKRKCIS